MPRAAPVRPSPASSASNGPSSFSTWVFSHSANRCLDRLAACARQMLVGQQQQARLIELCRWA
jgi:DNA-directed RNA polymerase specialized sigma24 family protein